MRRYTAGQARAVRRGWGDRVRLRAVRDPQCCEAFDNALAAARPGARVLIVDMALPTGWAGPAAPLARLACWAGGADPARHPWQVLHSRTVDVRHRVSRGGHLHAVMGRLPS